MKLSIIIPVFNEQKTIGKVINRVQALKMPSVNIEVIVVDDGSTDGTPGILKKLNLKNTKVFFHDKNSGKGTAVKTGIHHATGDYIVIQDADLEYDPQDIKKLLSQVTEKKAKVVYGTRLKRLPNFSRDERKPLFLIHYLGNRFLSLLTSILYGQWLTDMETCYKLFPKKAVTDMKLKAKRFDFEPEITSKLLKRGYKILEIPITTTPRGYEDGKKLHAMKDGTIALWTLFKYRFVN
ncbi:MAG: glycosyltransferase family 2 protein [Candidatus Levyibacteriota bacterium]